MKKYELMERIKDADPNAELRFMAAMNINGQEYRIDVDLNVLKYVGSVYDEGVDYEEYFTALKLRKWH